MYLNERRWDQEALTQRTPALAPRLTYSPIDARCGQTTKRRRMGTEERSEAVLGYLEDRRKELLDFACRLVATRSINPPGDERAVVDVIRSQMQTLGLEGVEVVGRTPERPNLIYRQRGKKGSPRLILNGHTDTKPVGEEDRRLWRTEPLKPTILDGRLYGLGSTDMKGAVAAMVYAAGALHALKDPPAGDFFHRLWCPRGGTATVEAGREPSVKRWTAHY